MTAVLQIPNQQRRAVLSRRIRLFAAATITYNVIEAVVALWAGGVSDSSALIGFGLDSVIEVTSALALSWQFSAKDPERREHLTLRIIAISFFALAAFVAVDAVRSLTGGGEARHSTPGIIIAALSLAIMPVLSWAQRRAGRELGSRTAVADSKQTLLCTYLSAVLLVGLVLNSTLGWWWADAGHMFTDSAGLLIALIAASWSQIMDDILARGADLAVRAVAAVLVASVIAGIGMLLRPFVQRRLQKQERPSRTRVFTALYSLSVAVFVVLVPITLVFPSVRVVDVLASLGVVSVAVGFAFKDVLENLLAGFLLLLRDPFKSGDQIKVAGYEGTVEGITVRETLLRTTDGERVLIPNAHVYTGALVVQTHYPTVRLTFRLLVDPHANPDLIRTTVTQALTPLNAEGAPPPDVVLRGAREGALEIEGPPVVQIRPRIANRCPGPRPPGGTASISRRGHRPGPAADRLRSGDPRGQPRQRRSRRPHVRAGEGL